MRYTMILAVIALVASVATALAAPATIEGSWRGSGIVTYGNGADDVQCRVRYTRATAKSLRSLLPMCHRERPLRVDRARDKLGRQSLHRLGAEHAVEPKRQG